MEAAAALQTLQSVPRATWVKTALQAGALGLLLAGHPCARVCFRGGETRRTFMPLFQKPRFLLVFKLNAAKKRV